MNKRIGIPLALFLTACGGSDFHTGAQTLDGPDGGPAATGGQPGQDGAVPGTGGAAGATGGSPGSGATGGNTAPDGAAGSTGGAPGGTGGTTVSDGGGGAPGTGGSTATDGGQADAPVKPVCKPPVITEANMPGTVVWDSFSVQSGTTCMACLSSPCATFQIGWYPVTQSADGLTVTAGVTQGVPVPMKLAACDAIGATTAPCVTVNFLIAWVGGGGYPKLTLAPKSDGSGYKVVAVSGVQISAGQANQPQSCNYQLVDSMPYKTRGADSLLAALTRVLLAAEWPCG